MRNHMPARGSGDKLRQPCFKLYASRNNNAGVPWGFVEKQFWCVFIGGRGNSGGR